MKILNRSFGVIQNQKNYRLVLLRGPLVGDVQGTIADEAARFMRGQFPRRAFGKIMAATQIPEFLTVKDVAERTKLSSEQIIRLIKAGRITAINFGLGEKNPRYRIEPEALEQFLRAGRTQPTPKARRGKTKNVIKFFE